MVAILLRPQKAKGALLYESKSELYELLHNSDDHMSVCAFMTYQ